MCPEAATPCVQRLHAPCVAGCNPVCRRLQPYVSQVSYVPVDEEGRVAAAAVAAAVTERTVLVTVMHSNNEVGAVQDLAEISAACKAAKPGVLVHTDAAQARRAQLAPADRVCARLQP